ncbi:MAG: cytoplasmic protein, partial [Deltaproteobacteria bacterium HGW-Deltaproteobacteria-7]
MIKKEMIYRNPLVNLGYENEDILSNGGFGAVLAYAGVGKTALLVQVALNAMLREQPVLHVSLNDAVSKVDVWYQELFHNIAENSGVVEVSEYWDKIQPYRFIMTFKVDGFSAPRLEERLIDLLQQNIFKPHTVIIDGFKFDDAGRGQLVQLKELA